MNKPERKLDICPYFHLQTFNKLILHLLRDHCSPEKLNFTCQSQLSRKFSWTIFDNNFCNFQQKRLSDCIHLHFVFTSLMAPSQKTFCPQKNCKKCTRSNNLTSNFLFVTGKQSILYHCVNCLKTIYFDIANQSRCSIMLFSVVCFATDYITTFV